MREIKDLIVNLLMIMFGILIGAIGIEFMWEKTLRDINKEMKDKRKNRRQYCRYYTFTDDEEEIDK